jgi:hypothetical protein
MAVSLCLLIVASGSPTAAFDPTRAVNNKDAAPPIDDGGGGGGGGGGTPTPKAPVALGVARPLGLSISDLDSFTATIGGQRPSIWVIWSMWGHANTRDFPTAVASALRDRGVTPMIWWEPFDPTDSGSTYYSRHANINAGMHDDYIRQYARDAKAFGGKVLLRFAQEVNGNYFPWSVNSLDNSPESFIAAWRRIHAIFQSEGATNAKFVWSVAKASCLGGCNPYAPVYPGDAWVDIMAFSAYNWGASKQWSSMYDSYRRVTELLSAISNKPIMVAETGSNTEGGDKAAWIRDGYPEVYQKLPQIRAIVYLDADLREVGHPDWRLASPAAALDAFAEIASMTEFTAASPFSAGLLAKDAPGAKRMGGGKKHASKAIRAKRQAKRALAANRGVLGDPTSRASASPGTPQAGESQATPPPPSQDGTGNPPVEEGPPADGGPAPDPAAGALPPPEPGT